jgi:hypothetical protein
VVTTVVVIVDIVVSVVTIVVIIVDIVVSVVFLRTVNIMRFILRFNISKAIIVTYHNIVITLLCNNNIVLRIV